jgi:hypothetical protein
LYGSKISRVQKCPISITKQTVCSEEKGKFQLSSSAPATKTLKGLKD